VIITYRYRVKDKASAKQRPARLARRTTPAAIAVPHGMRRNADMAKPM
jgi:hypothetical protein